MRGTVRRTRGRAVNRGVRPALGSGPHGRRDPAMESTIEPTVMTVDANEAVAAVAYRLSEVVAGYPITPASAMGEHALIRDTALVLVSTTRL